MNFRLEQERSMTCLDAGGADAPDDAPEPPAPAAQAAEGCEAFLSRSVLMPEAPSAGLEEAEESLTSIRLRLRRM